VRRVGIGAAAGADYRHDGPRRRGAAASTAFDERNRHQLAEVAVTAGAIASGWPRWISGRSRSRLHGSSPGARRRRRRRSSSPRRQAGYDGHMHLVQLLLPLYDNDGHRFDETAFAAVRQELTRRFGGVTAYMRS